MKKTILWQKPDGTLAHTTILSEENHKEHANKLLGQGSIPADWKMVGADVEWPDTGWQHECHRFDGKQIVVDLDAAREETKSRLRIERAALFAVNDLVMRDAIAENNEVNRIAALKERDRLRNITTEVLRAKTHADLKLLKARG